MVLYIYNDCKLKYDENENAKAKNIFFEVVVLFQINMLKWMQLLFIEN